MGYHQNRLKTFLLSSPVRVAGGGGGGGGSEYMKIAGCCHGWCVCVCSVCVCVCVCVCVVCMSMCKHTHTPFIITFIMWIAFSGRLVKRKASRGGGGAT